MLTVDDIVAQIRDLMIEDPNICWEQLATRLNRPQLFIKSICRLKGINLGIIPPAPAQITKIRHQQDTNGVELADPEYCDELLKYRSWVQNKDFSYKLGIAFAIRMFINMVDKTPGWSNEKTINQDTPITKAATSDPTATTNNRCSTQTTV